MPRPELTVKQILVWADAHRERTGRWPGLKSGRVRETADENWRALDHALRDGYRGWRRGQSLARLLAEHRGGRNRKALPKYSVRQHVTWADAHRARTGR